MFSLCSHLKLPVYQLLATMIMQSAVQCRIVYNAVRLPVRPVTVVSNTVAWLSQQSAAKRAFRHHPYLFTYLHRAACEGRALRQEGQADSNEQYARMIAQHDVASTRTACYGGCRRGSQLTPRQQIVRCTVLKL